MEDARPFGGGFKGLAHTYKEFMLGNRDRRTYSMLGRPIDPKCRPLKTNNFPRSTTSLMHSIKDMVGADGA